MAKRKNQTARLVIMLLVIAALAALAFLGLKIPGAIDLPGVFDDGSINKGLDLVGGTSIVFEADDDNPTSAEMQSVVELMRARLDSLGYTEGNVSTVGDNRVSVEIPGISDSEEAVKLLGSTAKLSFRDYQGNEVINGEDIKTASAEYGSVDKSGAYQNFVSITLTSDGVKKFSEKTGEIAGYSNGNNYIAIYLDEDEISRPFVHEKLTDADIMITGDFTGDYVNYLAGVIKSGNLPFALNNLSTQTISPTLGEGAFDKSMIAAGIGILLVMLFMIIIYRLPGLLCSITLVSYVAMISLIIVIFQINLSLPGIAGIILSIGMSVDANVIIFERFKDEIRSGKTPFSASKSGFKRAFVAIFDSNITTIIASIVLWLCCSGSEVGFAITLFIGVVISMLSSVVFTRVLLQAVASYNIKNLKVYGA